MKKYKEVIILPEHIVTEHFALPYVGFNPESVTPEQISEAHKAHQLSLKPTNPFYNNFKVDWVGYDNDRECFIGLIVPLNEVAEVQTTYGVSPSFAAAVVQEGLHDEGL